MIKYNFYQLQHQPDSETSIKKRKLVEPKRNENVIEYSQIKLPALLFLHYLEKDVLGFAFFGAHPIFGLVFVAHPLLNKLACYALYGGT